MYRSNTFSETNSSKLKVKLNESETAGIDESRISLRDDAKTSAKGRSERGKHSENRHSISGDLKTRVVAEATSNSRAELLHERPIVLIGVRAAETTVAAVAAATATWH